LERVLHGTEVDACYLSWSTEEGGMSVGVCYEEGRRGGEGTHETSFTGEGSSRVIFERSEASA
jgi:hypothetical protein